MNTNDDIEPVEIFAGTFWEAELLKSLLENEDIETFLRDENTSIIAPFYASPGGAFSVKVIVSNQDYARAKLIVEEFEKNMKKDV
jgi:hypothetical protein